MNSIFWILLCVQFFQIISKTEIELKIVNLTAFSTEKLLVEYIKPSYCIDILYLYVNHTGYGICTKTDEINSTHTKIGTFKAFELVNVTLICIKDSSDKINSNHLTGRTASDVGTPPSEINTNQSSKKNIQITWPKPVNNKGEIKNFIISIDTAEHTVKAYEYSIKDVIPYHNYSIAIKTNNLPVNDIGGGLGSEIKSNFRSWSGPGQKVEILKLESPSPNQISVTWKLTGDSTGVVQCYKLIAIDENLNELKNETKNTECIFTDAIPYTKYNITIYTINKPDPPETDSGGQGLATNSTTHVLTKPSIGVPPINITAFAVSKNALNISWKQNPKPHGVIMAYEIDLNETAYNAISSETSKIIENLNTFTKYVVKIRTKNLKDDNNPGEFGQFSTAINITTCPDVGQHVVDIKAKAVDDKSIKVSWSLNPNPLGIVSHYYILAKENKTNIEHSIQISASEKTGTISNLRPFEYYYISVITNNKNDSVSPDCTGGNGTAAMFNEPVKTKPINGVPPTHVKCSAPLIEKLLVDWDIPSEPMGIISEYKVCVKPKDNPMPNLKTKLCQNSKNNSIIMVNLTSFQTYTTTVSTSNEGSDGMFGEESTPIECKTSPGGGSAPNDVKIISAGMFACNATWNAPTTNPGQIKNYEAHLLQNGKLYRNISIPSNVTKYTFNRLPSLSTYSVEMFTFNAPNEDGVGGGIGSGGKPEKMCKNPLPEEPWTPIIVGSVLGSVAGICIIGTIITLLVI